MRDVSAGEGALSDRLVDDLQRRILTGEIEMGSWLRHGAIAEEFGISRTPVREALRILNARGIVTIVKNRGARVNGHSGHDLRELGQVRAELEGFAAELAADRINDDQLKQMRDALQDFSAAIEQYTADTDLSKTPEANVRWSRTNEAFHRAILEGSGNLQLRLSIEDISRRLPRNANYSAYSGNSRLLCQNLEEHKIIAEAIIARDRKKARQAMVKHIRSATESLARYVEERNH